MSDIGDIGQLIAQINVPKEFRETSLVDPEEYGYWKDRLDRVFYLDYDIDEEPGVTWCVELIKTINQINRNERDIPKEELKPIYLYVNCFGGSLDVGFHLADVIKSSRIPIYTIAMADCMSAAFIIFISGKKRFAYRHTQMLCHQGSISLAGNSVEVENAQASYKKQLKEMDNYILENTGIDPKVYARHKKSDWWLTAQEAIEYKVVDKIIEDSSDIYE